MRLVPAVALLVTAFVLAGCGGDSDSLTPVTGTITVDGSAGDGAAVAFIPQGKTAGNGGTALADKSGKYEILTPQGKKGLPPGEYKVTVSVRRNPDGTPADPNVPPMESKASEVLLPKFSDRERTELNATVSNEAKSFDFNVQSIKKK
jgi:hypothetical protein